MTKEVEEYVEYLLKRNVDPSMVSLSSCVHIIEVYKKAIEIFGEREDLVSALEINKKFYGE